MDSDNVDRFYLQHFLLLVTYIHQLNLLINNDKNNKYNKCSSTGGGDGGISSKSVKEIATATAIMISSYL